jgi:hypothetical protein
MWQTSWIGYMTSTTMSANVWSWPATEWKWTKTAWPTLWATKRETKCCCIAQPALKESHPSFNPHRRAHTG